MLRAIIRESAVNHRPGHDHASDGQGRYALCDSAATPAILHQAPLQDTYHCSEHGLEGALRATSVGNATIGQEFSTSSKCWRDR
jgi:hypothetical protein